MATNPEEFFAEDPSPASPSVVPDLPPMLDDHFQSPTSSDETVLSYISRVLMEEDTEDELLYQYSDHPALLQVQQPFAQILSSPSSRASDLSLQDNSDHQGTDDSSFPKGMDAVGAFLKGMEEANVFLPQDSGDELVNHTLRDGNSHCDNSNRASKAVTTMEPEKTSGSYEMLNEMMLRSCEIRSATMANLSISMATEKKSSKKSVNSRGITATEVVDLQSLLILCAQAVATGNQEVARELLKQIKKHASATGDAAQRLAQLFASGLEARLLGMGPSHVWHYWQLPMAEHASVKEFLQAYDLYMAAGCFIPVAIAYFITATTDAIAMTGKSKLHIVDYRPYLGFHLVSLLRVLASSRGGPLEVRVIAIGWPNLQSCSPDQTADIGNRLRSCARVLRVPFQFQAITMESAEKVRIEDLNTDADEVLVVNDFFKLSSFMDESVSFDQPSCRESIRELRPDVFIQSVMNYSCGGSFLSRYRGALFYYTALFDVLDATVPRDNKLRAVLEQVLLGCAARKVISCEGEGMLHRPEVYRKWQVRNQRAGLRQLPLKPQILNKVHKVKQCYHKDFLMSEDGQWLLQGWRGRVLFAHSTWVPQEASAAQ